MLTLHRLPRAYRVLYIGIALLLVAALLSHWWRLALRHGVSPATMRAWYLGDEAAMLFPRAGIEVAEDAWANVFHHTLAFLVLGGLLVRTNAAPRTRALVAVLFGAATVVSGLGPLLVWWGVPGAATLYVGTLGLLSGLGVAVLGMVARDSLAHDARGHRGTPGTNVFARAGTALLLLALLPRHGAAQQLLTERQAILKVFPSARMAGTDTIVPDSATRAHIEQQLGRALYEPEYQLRRLYRETGNPEGLPDGRGKRDTVLLGYSVVTEERGKYRPITMLVGVDTSGRVAGVQILAYRESRGGEVAREYFLRQYRGKAVGDPIRLNRDIINISGATISVQSVNAGVRKVLALLAWVNRSSPPLLPAPCSLLPVEELP